jgi:D-lyxose ketol-isomerase
MCTFHDILLGLIKSRRMRWAGPVARMGEMRNAYKILVVNPGQKTPLGRHTCRWEDNIRIDIREIGWEVVHWIHVTQDRDQWRAFVNAVVNF